MCLNIAYIEHVKSTSGGGVPARGPYLPSSASPDEGLCAMRADNIIVWSHSFTV